MTGLEDLFTADNDKGDFMYPDAGKNADPDVRLAIKYFRSLPASVRAKKPLLYWLLGSGTPPYKMSKKDSRYTHQPVKGQKCSNCRFAYQRVVDKKIICSQIEGEIKPSHWCRLWVGGDTIKNK
jgi:hypothetical protein